MTVDASDFDKLGEEFLEAAKKIVPETRKVVEKGSLNVKKEIQENFRGSSFEGAVRNIRYKVKDVPDGIEGSIAPYLEQEGFGSLVGIALYGSSKGGGGTVVDPIHALEAEAPRFEKALLEVAGLVLNE
ncbi:hypothetical protein QEH68_06720 [Paenarthrobacter sp. OM7]|uniref:hypothetical protein n=1 Tax=Paenarthrobacter sp. OM7 TaxID=3041264 RepID=UPI00246852A6|nr:hypothetical protein [Paenarthrobacter sp. OM7]WGM21861.1 hypothetical protein QEH68_06720 [Paenarthrobacter sp. OM7]